MMVELRARRFPVTVLTSIGRTGRFTSQLYGGSVLPIPYGRRGGSRQTKGSTTRIWLRLFCRFDCPLCPLLCAIVFTRNEQKLNRTRYPRETRWPEIEKIKRESFFCHRLIVV